MDAIILDSRMVESHRFSNYESFIFTERFNRLGDFTMMTYDIPGALKAIPKGSLISVDGSGEVAVAERYSLSLDSNGVESLVISGNLAMNVYDHRPCTPVIASTSLLDAEYPYGWEFGDPYSDIPDIHPMSIIEDIIERVDKKHYGRDELSDLRTPFTVNTIDYPPNLPKAFHSRRLPYFTVSRNTSTLSAIYELLDHANMGVFAMRPGSEDLFSSKTKVTTSKWEDGTLPLYFYTPSFKGKDGNVYNGNVAFTDYWEDYLSVVEEEDISSAPTHAFSLNEDFVISSTRGRHTGLNAKVFMSEVSIEDSEMTDLEIIELFHTSAVLTPSEEVMNGQVVNMELDGRYPFRQKKYGYSPDPNDDYFFLGDAVGYHTPWGVTESGVSSMRVVEFIRAMDTSGYREYPGLEPFVATSLPTYKSNGTLAFEPGTVRTNVYREFMRNMVYRETWT